MIMILVAVNAAGQSDTENCAVFSDTLDSCTFMDPGTA